MVRLPTLVASLAALTLVTSALAAGPEAYVGNFKESTVSVIGTTAGLVIATVPVAAGPDGIDAGRDDAQVFVSGSSATSLSCVRPPCSSLGSSKREATSSAMTRPAN